jgi:DNA-binding transcriptional LysR family regulator
LVDAARPAFEQLARPHLRSKRLKQVLAELSPTFPGFYLYYPTRRQQPSKLKAFVDCALGSARES